MPAFYSILQALIHPQTDEYLSVGLILCGDEGQVHFELSNEKLKAAKDILPSGSGKLLQTTVRNIYDSIRAPADQSGQVSLGLGSRFSTPEYLQYLSQYSHNLLRFTAPVRIDMPATQDTFLALFKRYIFDANPLAVKPAASVSPFEKLQADFYPYIAKRVNVGFTLTPEILPSLFIEAPVSFIGKNNVPVVGREIDFSKRSYNLGKDLNDMYALIKAFEAQGDEGQYYLVGNEPPKQLSKQHHIWDTMRQSRFLLVIPIEETEQIREYIELHNVRPYVEEMA